jgi:hypothetical protein
MKKKNFISVLMVLATIFFGCHGGKLRSVPDELQGVWKPSDLQYADRSIDFRQDTIIFGIGAGKFDSYSIHYLRMKRSRDGTSTEYTITYEDDEGEEYMLTLNYYPEDNGVIKLKYQEYIVWKREKDR